MTEPTVFIIDDDPGMQQSLAVLVQSIALNVETYASAQAFLDAVTPDRRGCLILDLRLPGMSGRELQTQLQQRGIHLPIIFLSGHGDIETAVAAIKEGAIDFLEKPCSGQRLLDQVQAALRLADEWRQRDQRLNIVRERLQRLSQGEYDVLQGIVDGKPYKTIAKELGLSYKTVEARRARIVKKMEVESLPELIRMVLEYQMQQTPCGSQM